MTPELHSLLSKVKEPEKVARLLDRVAERLDEMRAELFPTRKKTTVVEKVVADDE